MLHMIKEYAPLFLIVVGVTLSFIFRINGYRFKGMFKRRNVIFSMVIWVISGLAVWVIAIMNQ
jgi:hypothetical protein